MKVYIGWSGETSEKIASILDSCLPILNPHIETFVSVDMERGSALRNAFSEIISCDCALFCVTKENVNSSWLRYQAGAFSGQEKSVIPVFFDTSIRLLDPLSQFPSLTLKKDDMRKLAYALNTYCGDDAVSPEALDATFEGVYPTIERMLKDIRKSQEWEERQLERDRLSYEGIINALTADKRKNSLGVGEEELKQDFNILNSKLDAILSQLSSASPVAPHSENSL